MTNGRMTMGAAIRRIKQIQGEMDELVKQANTSACWAEGKEPPFKLEEIMKTRNALCDELIELKTALAKANATSIVRGVKDESGNERSPSYWIKFLAEIKASLKLVSELPIRDRVLDTTVTREMEWNELKSEHVYVSKTQSFYSAMTRPEQVVLIKKLRDRFQVVNDALEAHNHTHTI